MSKPKAETVIQPPKIDSSRQETQNLIAHVERLKAELDDLRNHVAFQDRRDQAVQSLMQRMDEEMRLASRLQRDFLPRKLPSMGRLSFAAMWRPAGYVSGDLYDVMRLDEKHIGLFLCDAVGHGVPAALLTMFIKRALVTKSIKPDHYRLLTPGESLSTVNESLVEQELSQATFATAAYAVVNMETLATTLSAAGHPYPLLLHPNGEIDTLKAEGALLGIFSGEEYVPIDVNLQAGDKLIIYSDGIDGAFPDPKDATEMFTLELQKRASLSAAEMIADIEAHLDHSDGSLAPKDDLTILVCEPA